MNSSFMAFQVPDDKPHFNMVDRVSSSSETLKQQLLDRATAIAQNSFGQA